MKEIEEVETVLGLAGDVLDERPATATWLYYVEDLSVKEIALILGCTRAVVEDMLMQTEDTFFPLLAGS